MYKAKHMIELAQNRTGSFPAAQLNYIHYLSWQLQYLPAEHKTSCCEMQGRRQNTEHKQGTARIEGSAAHLMSHLGESGDVTDLQAWVGWGL